MPLNRNKAYGNVASKGCTFAAFSGHTLAVTPDILIKPGSLKRLTRTES